MIWIGLFEPIVPWTLCLSSEVFTGFFLPGFTDLNLVFFVVCKVVFLLNRIEFNGFLLPGPFLFASSI